MIDDIQTRLKPKNLSELIAIVTEDMKSRKVKADDKAEILDELFKYNNELREEQGSYKNIQGEQYHQKMMERMSTIKSKIDSYIKMKGY